MSANITENMVAGFIGEAQARGVPEHQIPQLLKVASWLQAYAANPRAFEAGMMEAAVKSAAPAGLVKRVAGTVGKWMGRGAKATAKAKPAPKAPPKAAPKPAPKAAPKPAPKAAPKPAPKPAPKAPPKAAPKVAPVLPKAAPAPAPAAPAPAAKPGFKARKLILPGAYMGAGALALHGGKDVADTMAGASADQRMLDQIAQYRNQYADFVTRQNLMNSLPGMQPQLRSQPRLWSPGF